MSKKQIISIIIIVIAFAGAGVLLYYALGISPSAIVKRNSGEEIQVSSAILPKGTSLDFSSVKKFNKDGRLFQYPSVTPTDVGSDVNTLVK